MKWRSVVAAAAAALTLSAAPAKAGPADATRACSGRFPNPITHVCWSCLFPLTLGSIPLFKGSRPDAPNPASPICVCPAPPPLFFTVGLSVGFWEPVRLADVTPKAWCFPNLGGMNFSPGFGYPTKSHRSVDRQTDRSGYHIHWYVYPALYWLELLTDFACMDRASFDIAYVTELDPLWQDDQLAALINPEVALFANPIAQAACAADCAIASATGMGRRELFWCAGCQGSFFPMSGNVAGEYGTLQGGLLAAERFAFKMHRQLLASGTMGSQGLCGKYPMPVMDKRQYRFQLINPVAHTDGLSCNAIGETSVIYEHGKVAPVVGEDLGWLVWRKRNCCVGSIGG